MESGGMGDFVTFVPTLCPLWLKDFFFGINISHQA